MGAGTADLLNRRYGRKLEVASHVDVVGGDIQHARDSNIVPVGTVGECDYRLSYEIMQR